MNYGLSDQVRELAAIIHVRPAIAAGKRQFSISVKELLHDLQSRGFPTNHARQVCAALSSGKFLRENNIEVETIDGPPSKTSTTVVVHYRLAPAEAKIASAAEPRIEEPLIPSEETPEEWAHRVTRKISGLLSVELAGIGGGEAFIRWVRGYDEEDAA